MSLSTPDQFLGSTALHLAAATGQVGLINYILDEAKVDVAIENADGRNALHYAAEVRTALVAWDTARRGKGLARMRACVRACVRACMHDTCVRTVQGGQDHVIRLLLQRGLTLNKPNKDGCVPVHCKPAACRPGARPREPQKRTTSLFARRCRRVQFAGHARTAAAGGRRPQLSRLQWQHVWTHRQC